MDITCVHCVKTINAAASVCPWCHREAPMGNWSNLTASQRILMIANLTKVGTVLTIFGIGIYLAVKLFW